MNTQPIKISFACLAILVSTVCSRAGTITKANNTDNLNLTTSWTNGVVPGSIDVARWDFNVTGANSVALGADTNWAGIIITNPGGPVTITAGNVLTIGANGIDMSRASQNLTLSSDLTLGPGLQRWNVTNGTTLTVNGTFTRSAAATLAIGASSIAAASQGTVTASPSLENGVVPWATAQSSGAATNGTVNGSTFATVSGGNIVAYTNATLETNSDPGVSFGGIPTGDNSTVNYDLGVASTGGSMTNDIYVDTLRDIGGAYTQNGTANFRANAIMNAGTGLLTIGTPMQQADTTLNEMVLAAWTQGITLNGLISDNVNPLQLTVTGTNTQNIVVSAQNTFSGGVTIDAGRVGILANSTPASGTVTSGPLGTGTITMNGGTVYAGSGGWAIGNPIFVGPGGGSFQYATASPDLTINGNITGSGTVTMAGVFNVNGLFFNGDDSAFNGTVIVTGANNRLGTGASGSALAKWVINGALSAQLVGGATYYLGELSSTVSSGSLNGHAGNLTPAIQNFVVGALNTSSTFSGILANNAANNAQTGNSDAAANNLIALTKVGTGTLTLSGANTATGPLTISAGTLQLGAGSTTGTLSPSMAIQDDAIFTINRSSAVVQGVNFSSSGIGGLGSFVQAGTGATTLNAANTYAGDTTVSNGTLFVNGSISSTASVMSGAKLGGNGTIGGVVTVQSGGQLGAGSNATSIGTLTLYSTPVLGGSILVKISAAAGQADQIAVPGYPINYAGSLTVSNIGVPLLAGDTFTIFSAGLHNGNFSSVVGSPGTGLAYSFTNGILSVVSTGAAYATNSTPTSLSAALGSDINGNPLTAVGWPSDHLGWLLQSQTDLLGIGLQSSPWVDLPGSAVVTWTNIPVDPTIPGTYYRLRYVSPPLAVVPTGLAARATNHAAVLNWTAAASARSYNVKNSTVSGGPYTTVANLSSTSYTNTGLANGTTYYFVVSALNYYGETANSTEVSATPVAIPPAAPTGLTAQAAHGEVQLNWTAVGGASSYNVKSGTTAGGPYSIIGNIATSSFLDTNVVDGTTYYYVVSALNIDAESTNSAEVNATPQAAPPAVPIGVVATGQYIQVKVTWTASFGATSYNVKVATTSGGPYTTLTNTTSTTVYDTGLTADTPYYFVVSALNDIGESADSTEATATPTSVLPLNYDFEFLGASYPLPPLPALGDPSLPFIEPLPDPYYWANDPYNLGNTASTNFSDWEHHRAEFKAQIENYEIGVKPSVDPSNITVSISGTGTTRTLTVIVTNVVSGTNRTLTLSSAISLPASSGTFPIIIGMNSPNGSVNASLLTSVAKVTYNINQVTTYGTQLTTDPYYLLYAAPSVPALDTFNTGQYSAWAWGCSRLIDGLYKLKGNLGGGVQIDLTRLAVTGCSYAGKMALFCGAYDERVTLTIAQESGGGGAPVWRYSATEPAGTVEWLPNTDHNWFSEGMFAFGASNNVSYLPEDHHELMAMVAPRALFATDNPDYVWLSNPSAYVSCKATEQVYSNFGVVDRFGYNIVGGHAHCSTTSTIDSEMGAFINKFLLSQTNANTLIRDVDPTITNTVDYARWTMWWGTTSPILP